MLLSSRRAAIDAHRLPQRRQELLKAIQRLVCTFDGPNLDNLPFALFSCREEHPHRHPRLAVPLAELLGQRDDDPRGAADIAEPVAVLVLGQLTDEFGATRAQAGNDVLDVVDGEHDAM